MTDFLMNLNRTVLLSLSLPQENVFVQFSDPQILTPELFKIIYLVVQQKAYIYLKNVDVTVQKAIAVIENYILIDFHRPRPSPDLCTRLQRVIYN